MTVPFGDEDLRMCILTGRTCVLCTSQESEEACPFELLPGCRRYICCRCVPKPVEEDHYQYLPSNYSEGTWYDDGEEVGCDDDDDDDDADEEEDDEDDDALEVTDGDEAWEIETTLSSVSCPPTDTKSCRTSECLEDRCDRVKQQKVC